MVDHNLATNGAERLSRGSGRGSVRVRSARRFVASTIADLGKFPVGDHTDLAMTGLQLRVRGKGQRRASGTFPDYSRTWLYRTLYAGKWLRVTVGHRPTMSLADARDEVRAIGAFANAGYPPNNTPEN